jgi:hypothetical protein
MKEKTEYHTASFSMDDVSHLNLKHLAAEEGISISGMLRKLIRTAWRDHEHREEKALNNLLGKVA